MPKTFVYKPLHLFTRQFVFYKSSCVSNLPEKVAILTKMFAGNCWRIYMWVSCEVRMYDPINLVPFEADGWSKSRRDSLMQMGSNDSYKYLAVMNPTQQNGRVGRPGCAAYAIIKLRYLELVFILYLHAGKNVWREKCLRRSESHRHSPPPPPPLWRMMSAEGKVN